MKNKTKLIKNEDDLRELKGKFFSRSGGLSLSDLRDILNTSIKSLQLSEPPNKPILKFNHTSEYLKEYLIDLVKWEDLNKSFMSSVKEVGVLTEQCNEFLLNAVLSYTDIKNYSKETQKQALKLAERFTDLDDKLNYLLELNALITSAIESKT